MLVGPDDRFTNLERLAALVTSLVLPAVHLIPLDDVLIAFDDELAKSVRRFEGGPLPRQFGERMPDGGIVGYGRRRRSWLLPLSMRA